MNRQTLTSREFNQNTSRAKKASETGPVFITDRGEPAHVLMTFEHYQRLTTSEPNIGELLSMEGAESIELEIPRRLDLPRIVEFD